jgi:hypothetical protein
MFSADWRDCSTKSGTIGKERPVRRRQGIAIWEAEEYWEGFEPLGLVGDRLQ